MTRTQDDPADGPSVPAKIRPKYDAVAALTDTFCRDHLDAECAAMCREVAAVLARKRPSPLATGAAAGWAAGVARAVVWANFLDDPSCAPHAKPAAIDKAIGVSPATGAAKGMKIRNLLKMSRFDPEWTLPSKLGDNPLAWLVELNDGLVVDARHLPRHVQEDAAARGIIPYVPGEDRADPPPAELSPAKTSPVKTSPAPGKSPPPRGRNRRGSTAKSVGPGAADAGRGKPVSTGHLYTLEVFISSGPISAAFAKANPVVARTIQIRGDQTLADLHETIFDAFGREDEHLYEFQFGKGPMDPKGPRYVLQPRFGPGFDDGGRPPAGYVEETTLDDLALTADSSFDYWFDFGDDWWHQINVMAVDGTVPPGRFPRVTEREGASPPQYMDWDGEDE